MPDFPVPDDIACQPLIDRLGRQIDQLREARALSRSIRRRGDDGSSALIEDLLHAARATLHAQNDEIASLRLALSRCQQRLQAGEAEPVDDREAEDLLFFAHPQALLVVDVERRLILAANPAACEQYGWRGDGWRGLGAGVGYVQAQDALCTLAGEDGEETWHVARRGFMLHGRPHELTMLRHMTRELGRQEVALQAVAGTLAVLKADETLFQTGWFVESLSTQVLVIFIIRTRGNPFKSRAHPILTATSLAVVAMAAVLPLTSQGKYFGFVPPPAQFYAILAAMVVFYLVMVEVAKRGFYRWYRTPKRTYR